MFTKSDTKTFCPWKGEAEYYTIKHGGKQTRVPCTEQDANVESDKTIHDAAWYYADPYEKAENIKDHIAFCMESPMTEMFGCTLLMLIYNFIDKSKISVTVE